MCLLHAIATACFMRAVPCFLQLHILCGLRMTLTWLSVPAADAHDQLFTASKTALCEVTLCRLLQQHRPPAEVDAQHKADPLVITVTTADGLLVRRTTVKLRLTDPLLECLQSTRTEQHACRQHDSDSCEEERLGCMADSDLTRPRICLPGYANSSLWFSSEVMHVLCNADLSLACLLAELNSRRVA